MDQQGTQSTFGFKWENFPIDDETRTKHFRPEHRIERYGWEPSEFEDWIEGRTVLDAGCGMGWWTDHLTNYNETGAVYGLDIAVDAVRKGGQLGNDRLLIGDMGTLPFPEETFDYIACEEALHHTPDPPRFLQHLVDHLKPGGTYTMYVYKEKPFLRELADTNLREETTEMDIEACMKFSEQLTELGKELYEVNETISVPDIDLLDVEAGEYSVHEFVYRHLLKCYFDWDTEDRNASVAVNFDWYHPEHAFRYDEQEVREMVTDTGLRIEHFEKLMSGFCVRATKE